MAGGICGWWRMKNEKLLRGMVIPQESHLLSREKTLNVANFWKKCLKW